MGENGEQRTAIRLALSTGRHDRLLTEMMRSRWAEPRRAERDRQKRPGQVVEVAVPFAGIHLHAQQVGNGRRLQKKEFPDFRSPHRLPQLPYRMQSSAGAMAEAFLLHDVF
eukprot:3014122-Pleurochrysis_carterae.AAC.1